MLSCMNFFRVFLFSVIVLLPLEISGQDKAEVPDLFEMAESEADRLQELLDLEDWQVFYVDSTLKNDYSCMQKEMEELQKAKVSNYTMYQSVQDRWMEKIDGSYRKIFTDEQWKHYLKSGAAKQQKAREKRRLKAEESLEKEK